VWRSVPAPEPIPNAKHLQRQIRYVHLNPCHDGLVDDPLCWPWSTQRGAVGLELDPWVSPADISSFLCRTGTARWLHDYVSSDPSVNVAGTPFPVPARRQAMPTAPLAAIADAARAAVPDRIPLQRHLLVLLAEHQGWRDTRLIADAAGITPGQVRRLLKRRAPELLRVGAYCLGDARLRHVPDLRI
jgi:hypothetical protein